MELKSISISPVEMDIRKNLDIRSGDTVRVWIKIQEGDKVRSQAFEGMVLAKKHGKEAGSTFTVRRVIDGIGVERIFPLYASVIDRIEILKRAEVRRAKLYYIRDKAVKELRRNMKSLILETKRENNTDTKIKTVAKKEEVKVEDKKAE